MSTVTSVRLQDDLDESLEQLAGKLSRSKNWLINEAVRTYLETQTLQEQRWAETIASLASVRAGKVAEADEVHEWLDSWGSADELPPPKT